MSLGLCDVKLDLRLGCGWVSSIFISLFLYVFFPVIMQNPTIKIGKIPNTRLLSQGPSKLETQLRTSHF